MPVDIVNQAATDNSDTVETGDPTQDSNWGSLLTGLASVVAAATPIIQSATGNNAPLRYDPATKQWTYGQPTGYYGVPAAQAQAQSNTLQKALVLGLIVVGAVYALKHL